MKLYSPLKISDTYSEIAQSMISNLDELINQQSLTKENLNESLEQFRCLVLHKNFFRTSLHSFRKKEEINLFKKELFSNIHKEIVTNDEAMDILENFGIRVEHMKEKYEEVATFSVNCIKNFFFNIELKPRKDLYSLLKERTSLLNQQIWSLPSNQQLKYHLFSAGYNLSYLDRDHYLRISITESIQEIEDYHRKVLLSFYTEYLQILRHVRLEKIPLSSEIIIPSYNLWTSDLSLLELKSRREKVVKLIQQVASSLNPPSKRIFHRLSALKEKEESLDNEIKLRKQKTQKQKQNFFQVVISHSFWNSLKYFNSTFSGCYAPGFLKYFLVY